MKPLLRVLAYNAHTWVREQEATSTNKPLAKWQGPYAMVRKMGPVTYEIHHLDKGKTRQTYHVNLLKEWKVPPSKGPETSLFVKVEEESENAK